MAAHRSSGFAIVTVLLAEIAVALLLAGLIAQAYIAFECSDSAYKEEHATQCEGGVPYPIF